MKDRVCLPNVKDLRKLIMEEAYCSTYAMHPCSTKMYWTIKKNYWWSGIKKYHRIRVEMFSVPTSEDKTSKTSWNPSSFTYPKKKVGTHHYGLHSRFTSYFNGLRSIWVIVDRLTKSAHFLAIHNNISLDRLARLYINEIANR